jgi:protein-arginine kinase activator protein McsA
MALELTLNNSDEFQEMLDKKDFKIAEAIVEAILGNLNTKKNNVHILSVNFTEDESVYDLTLDRKYFAETLETNLKYFVEKEMYEKCTEITDAIEILKK